MVRLGKVSILVAALLIPVFGAAAQDQDTDKVSVFSPFGFTRIIPSPGKPCVVESILTEDAFIKAIPTLQKFGILNPDLTQTAINTKPHMIEYAFTMQIAPIVTEDLFEKNTKVATCQFKQILVDTDDYGASRRRIMFSYRFDRSTNNRVNWENFKSTSFPKIAPDFKFENWFGQSLNEEMGN